MKPNYSNRRCGLPTMSTMDRLMNKIKVNHKTNCWEWTGATYNGYGKTTIGSRIDNSRKTITVHRLSYELNNGTIPQGMFVCHKCDNRKCINPDHLFVGTRQDNVDDRESKNRNIVKTGESNPTSKLTQKIVKNCRWENAFQGVSVYSLAKKYGVNKKTMQNAVKGVTWKCVPYFPEPPKGE